MAAAKNLAGKTAKKVATKNPVSKMSGKKAGAKARSKSALIGGIAEKLGMARKDVSSVLAQLSEEAMSDLAKGGPGIFTIPGLCKLKTIKKAAKPAREGINPLTGQKQIFKAQPAKNIVKIRPLKALKDSVI